VTVEKGEAGPTLEGPLTPGAVGLLEAVEGQAWIKTADHRFVFVNQQFARALNCDPGDALGATEDPFFERWRVTDQSHMTRELKQMLGITPGALRRLGDGRLERGPPRDVVDDGRGAHPRCSAVADQVAGRRRRDDQEDQRRDGAGQRKAPPVTAGR